MIYKGVTVYVTGDTLPEEEQAAYAERALDRYGSDAYAVHLHVCEDNPEEIDITYDLRPQKFLRLRRITGYLVGNLDRWNNGKRAEERDRVKHT